MSEARGRLWWLYAMIISGILLALARFAGHVWQYIAG